MRFSLTAFALAALVTGCATPQQKPADARPGLQSLTFPPSETIPSYITSPTGCAILAGGGLGSTFADRRVTGFWHEVNKEITEHLHARMKVEKFNVVKLIVPIEQMRGQEQPVIEAMARHRCNRVLQVMHDVDEDAAGKYFKFKVSLLHIEPKGQREPGAKHTPVVTVGDFEREYRYPRNEETFKTFETSTFAYSVYRDLATSGKLEAIR
jgi:hypothetical protein